MDIKEFKEQGHKIVDLISKYFEEIESYPVKSQVKPKEVFNQLPENPPQTSEDFKTIISDFNNIIMPGITHWQSPNFHAYFPANNSYPSILAEFLTASLGAQCMVWETSPAAAELEERVLLWLRDAMGLPDDFEGVIQDTASTATLVSILTAREYISNFNINNKGYQNQNYRVYCSTEAHSSIDKAVKIAGIGKSNLVKINVDQNYSMIPEEFEKAIKQDLLRGFKPLSVIIAFGTTGSTAVDPIEEISKIAKKYNIWVHVDAAFAGSAFILPEMQHYLKGIENIDTFVFNPHKWLFTNFDCSVYFIKNKEALIRTFEISPEYLKTKTDKQVNNYRDWGIALGRRFRALKLWFVIRSFGIEGLQNKLREHIQITKIIETYIKNHKDFELLAPINFNVICFRYNPQNINKEELNLLNERLLNKINNTGEMYLSHTKLNGVFTLRLVIGQTYVNESHLETNWKKLTELAKDLK